MEQHIIDEHNQKQLAAHRRRFEFLASEIPGIEHVMEQLTAFNVAIPSWALGTGGTRFGRFSGGGEPRSLEEKIEDVGLIHALNRSSNSISLHIPWDIPDNPASVKNLATSLGLHFDAVNSNTFQDQPGQKLSYKFGSLHHVDKAVRQQAIEHNIEVIKYGVQLDSKALSVWLSDGSNFPGQLNFRGAFERTLDSLQQIYDSLPADWKMWIEYKPFEPNFYSTTIGDWGQSLLLASKLGNKAYTLVDLGHHLQGTNIEQIVSLLLMEGKLAGFHFNDSKYGDDDLTVGSINPYQLFLIFNELVEGMNARKMNHATGIGWMIDASHNVKDPIEDLLQSVEAIKIAYAQALLVDAKALCERQQNNDVAGAQEILQAAYRRDVRPLVAEARVRAGGALEPTTVFRERALRDALINNAAQKPLQPACKMERIPVIAIFDVGKTNKKIFLFGEDYQIVFQDSTVLHETKDEDDFPCEDIEKLTQWLLDSFRRISQLSQFEIKAINFSGYGASFVYVGDDGKPIAPLYNYLKPSPDDLKYLFYNTYGGEHRLCLQTASPALGNLNSGLQLYSIKHQKPELFKQIKYALHLPQYLSSVFSGSMFSDITSIGCHTALWDFERNDYHDWVYKENISKKLAPIKPADTVVHAKGIKIGIGMHDSSSALIPYLVNFKEPFVLLSTGTWSISLNPFNQSPLTAEQLQNDCLNYITFDEKAVKAARFFIGQVYDEGVKQISDKFGVDKAVFKDLEYNPETTNQPGYIEAYYKLLKHIVDQQKKSTSHVLQHGKVKRLFVDGGFSRNNIFMQLLAEAFPQTEVLAASIPEGTALGAAMSIHRDWNKKPIPEKLIALKKYPGN